MKVIKNLNIIRVFDFYRDYRRFICIIIIIKYVYSWLFPRCHMASNKNFLRTQRKNFRFSFRKRGKIDSNLFPIMMWHKGYAAYDTLEICMPSKLNLSIFPGFFSQVCACCSTRGHFRLHFEATRRLPDTKDSTHFEPREPVCLGRSVKRWFFLHSFITQSCILAAVSRIFTAGYWYASLFLSLSLSSSTLSFYALVGHKNPIDSTRLSGSDWVVWKMQAIWICSGTNR